MIAQRICSIDGCDRVHFARGWCSLHYSRWQRNGEPIGLHPRPRLVCVIDGCDRYRAGHGLCSLHYRRWRHHGDPLQRWPRKTPGERFWPKVSKTESCWLWVGSKTPNGYGQFMGNEGRLVTAHRWAYEEAHGPIPEGLQLDHLCRNRACVNPDHLEPVTQRVNILRGTGWAASNASKTHCIHGHEFTPENTIPARGGTSRHCRECKRQRDRTYRERRKAS